MEAGGAHSSCVERVPLMAAGARPAVVLAGRPTTERAPNARAGRAEAFFLIEVAIQDNRLVMRDGGHAPLLWPGSDSRSSAR